MPVDDAQPRCAISGEKFEVFWHEQHQVHPFLPCSRGCEVVLLLHDTTQWLTVLACLNLGICPVHTVTSALVFADVHQSVLYMTLPVLVRANAHCTLPSRCPAFSPGQRFHHILRDLGSKSHSHANVSSVSSASLLCMSACTSCKTTDRIISQSLTYPTAHTHGELSSTILQEWRYNNAVKLDEDVAVQHGLEPGALVLSSTLSGMPAPKHDVLVAEQHSPAEGELVSDGRSVTCTCMSQQNCKGDAVRQS